MFHEYRFVRIGRAKYVPDSPLGVCAMARKLFCAMFVMTIGIGFVCADEFTATITKVDGDKVTYQKYLKVKKGEEKK